VVVHKNDKHFIEHLKPIEGSLSVHLAHLAVDNYEESECIVYEYLQERLLYELHSCHHQQLPALKEEWFHEHAHIDSSLVVQTFVERTDPVFARLSVQLLSVSYEQTQAYKRESYRNQAKRNGYKRAESLAKRIERDIFGL
jgi:hypothetical protein